MRSNTARLDRDVRCLQSPRAAPFRRRSGRALADSYFRHARIAAYIAVATWAVAMLMRAGQKL